MENKTQSNKKIEEDQAEKLTKMKYRDRKELKESVKKILSADSEAIENTPQRPMKHQIKKIREYGDEI